MSLRVSGKRVKISTKVTNKQLAEKIYAKQLLDSEEGRSFPNEAEKRTFEELKERYMRDHSRVTKAQTSIKRDKSIFDHLSEFFDEMTLAAITPGKLSDYNSKRIQEKALSSTIARELGTFRNALNKAIEWGWLEVNPFRKFKIHHVNNKKERWLTKEEEQKLLEASPVWLRELIIFSLNVGTRQSETLNLQWPQVDLEGKTVTLLITKNREKRTIPLNSCVVDLLKAKIRKRNNSGYVFQSQAGTRLIARNLIRSFTIARKKAGLNDLRWHDLRHTFASRLVQDGIDIYKVQKLLGHKDGRVTQRYAHLSVESLRKAVDQIGHTLVIPVGKMAGTTS